MKGCTHVKQETIGVQLRQMLSCQLEVSNIQAVIDPCFEGRFP